jgi:hypothetical protein
MTRLSGTVAAGVAVLIAAIAFFPREIPRESPAATAPDIRADARVTERKSHRPAPRPDSSAANLPAPADPPHTAGSPAHQEWIDARIAELDELAWQEDSASLQKILTEIRSPESAIRAAAIAATREFGSRDAVPYLRAIADETRDPAESKVLTELIEYLDLPTIVEQAEQDLPE